MDDRITITKFDKRCTFANLIILKSSFLIINEEKWALGMTESYRLLIDGQQIMLTLVFSSPVSIQGYAWTR